MVPMERNVSVEIVFVLLGFTDYPELQIPLFLIFFFMYIITVVGNLGMILLINTDHKFHTPMYFFLSHLSFVDFCYPTIIMPKLLENMVLADKTILYFSCMLQYFLSCVALVAESYLLAVMAYDRFVAICNPLLYTVVMSQRLCILLVTGSYIWSTFATLILLCYALQLKFSRFNVINHFCEYTAFIAVSSSDIHIPSLLLFCFATFNEVSTLLIILTSYVFIFVTVLKIKSASGRRKAFSTCASHLTAITIFHGTILSLYCVPNSKNSRNAVKVASVFYAVVNPLLNPLIYSLRNKDVKEVFQKLVSTSLKFPLH